MVEEVYRLKNQLLQEMAQDVQERGIERLDKEKVDMVKDLAEAEKSCWEAEYYRAVTEAMQGGYNGYQNARSGAQMASQGMSGWQNQYGSGYSRRGYGHSDALDSLKVAMRDADPQERERMMEEMRKMANGQM